MPITYEILPQDRIVSVALTGALAVQDYRDAARRLLAEPALCAGCGLLVDGRGLAAAPSIQELRALVQVARDLAAAGVAPFALIAGDDLQLLAGRLFAVFVGSVLNLDARVFDDPGVARAWLAAVAPQMDTSAPDTASPSGDGGSTLRPPA